MGFTESNALRPTLPPISQEPFEKDHFAMIVPGNTIYMPGTPLIPVTVANRTLEGVHIAVTQDAVNKAREEQLKEVGLDLGVISGKAEEPKRAFGIVGALIFVGIIFLFLR